MFKITPDGSISGYVIDYYDFSIIFPKNNNFDLIISNNLFKSGEIIFSTLGYNLMAYINNNAYRQQVNKELSNYVIIIPIKIYSRK